MPCPSCGQRTGLLMPSSKPTAPETGPKPPPTPQPKSAPVILPVYDLIKEHFEYDCESAISSALKIFAVIEFIGAVIGGFMVGSDNSPELGFAVFAAGVLSGLVLLGFATVIEYTKASAERLKRIEIILQQAVKK